MAKSNDMAGLGTTFNYIMGANQTAISLDTVTATAGATTTTAVASTPVNCSDLTASSTSALVNLLCSGAAAVVAAASSNGPATTTATATMATTGAITDQRHQYALAHGAAINGTGGHGLTASAFNLSHPLQFYQVLLDANTSVITSTGTSITATSNGTEMAVDGSGDIMQKTASLQIIFCIFYAIVFVLGIVGNVLVCYVVFRNRAMQTVTNYFITNLALSDILLCILAVPFTPLYTFLERWVFGLPLCHLVPYAQGCSVYISTLTLTAVAIDRFFVIVYPFQPRMKLSVCIGIIVSIWVFALLVTLPYGLYMRIQVDAGQSFCEEDWPETFGSLKIMFSICTTMLQFVIPLVVIAFCYVSVSIKLNDRARSKPGSKTSKREEADRDRKRRTNRMLIAMVAVFAISWLPLNLYNILADFHVWADTWSYSMLLFFVTHAIAMSSTCYNPFLYAWLNENFRKEFISLLPCIFSRLMTLETSSLAKGGGKSSRRPGAVSSLNPERNNNNNNTNINNNNSNNNNANSNYNSLNNNYNKSILNSNTDEDSHQQSMLLVPNTNRQRVAAAQDETELMCQRQNNNNNNISEYNLNRVKENSNLLNGARDPGDVASRSLIIPMPDPISSCTSSSCTTSSTISNSVTATSGKPTVSHLSPQRSTVDTTIVGAGILETHFEEGSPFRTTTISSQ